MKKKEKLVVTTEKQSWIQFLGLDFLFRIFCILAFLSVYLLWAIPLTNQWWKIYKTRKDNIKELPIMLDTAKTPQDYARIEGWIMARAYQDSDYIFERIDPYTPHFSPALFFNFWKRSVKQNDSEGALFWLTLAKFRMQFDAMRCGVPDSVQKSRELLEGLYIFTDPTLHNTSTAETMQAVYDVLAYDAQYPAHNDPSGLCDMLNQRISHKNIKYHIYPEKAWDEWRFILRRQTDAVLLDRKEKMSQEPSSTDDADHLEQ